MNDHKSTCLASYNTSAALLTISIVWVMPKKNLSALPHPVQPNCPKTSHMTWDYYIHDIPIRQSPNPRLIVLTWKAISLTRETQYTSLSSRSLVLNMVLTMILQDYMGMDMEPVCQTQKCILILEDNIKKLFFL